MEARLYELIRHYQVGRAAAIGEPVAAFRAEALRQFAQRRPERYPEYFAEDGRLSRAIEPARREGEILPSPTDSRDEPLVLRVDLDRGR